MIIPVRCFTCNKILGNKWNKYKEELQKLYLKENINEDKKQKFVDVDQLLKTEESKILDNLGLKRYCCRKMIITHNDMCRII